MLAPLVLDLLYVCLIMLASGWIYDVVHSSEYFGLRGPHFATGLPIAKIGEKSLGCERTSFHA